MAGWGLDDQGLVPERDRSFSVTAAPALALGPNYCPIYWVLGGMKCLGMKLIAQLLV